jgi:hypothetical protein
MRDLASILGDLRQNSTAWMRDRAVWVIAIVTLLPRILAYSLFAVLAYVVLCIYGPIYAFTASVH